MKSTSATSVSMVFRAYLNNAPLTTREVASLLLLIGRTTTVGVPDVEDLAGEDVAGEDVAGPPEDFFVIVPLADFTDFGAALASFMVVEEKEDGKEKCGGRRVLGEGSGSEWRGWGRVRNASKNRRLPSWW